MQTTRERVPGTRESSRTSGVHLCKSGSEVTAHSVLRFETPYHRDSKWTGTGDRDRQGTSHVATVCHLGTQRRAGYSAVQIGQYAHVF